MPTQLKEKSSTEPSKSKPDISSVRKEKKEIATSSYPIQKPKKSNTRHKNSDTELTESNTLSIELDTLSTIDKNLAYSTPQSSQEPQAVNDPNKKTSGFITDGGDYISYEDMSNYILQNYERGLSYNNIRPKQRDLYDYELQRILDYSKDHLIRVDATGAFHFNEGDFASTGKDKRVFGFNVDKTNSARNHAYSSLLTRFKGGFDANQSYNTSYYRNNTFGYNNPSFQHKSIYEDPLYNSVVKKRLEYDTLKYKESKLTAYDYQSEINNYFNNYIVNAGGLTAYSKTYPDFNSRKNMLVKLLTDYHSKLADPQFDSQYKWSDNTNSKLTITKNLGNAIAALNAATSYTTSLRLSLASNGLFNILHKFLDPDSYTQDMLSDAEPTDIYSRIRGGGDGTGSRELDLDNTALEDIYNIPSYFRNSLSVNNNANTENDNKYELTSKEKYKNAIKQNGNKVPGIDYSHYKLTGPISGSTYAFFGVLTNDSGLIISTEDNQHYYVMLYKLKSAALTKPNFICVKMDKKYIQKHSDVLSKKSGGSIPKFQNPAYPITTVQYTPKETSNSGFRTVVNLKDLAKQDWTDYGYVELPNGHTRRWHVYKNNDSKNPAWFIQDLKLNESAYFVVGKDKAQQATFIGNVPFIHGNYDSSEGQDFMSNFALAGPKGVSSVYNYPVVTLAPDANNRDQVKYNFIQLPSESMISGDVETNKKFQIRHEDLLFPDLDAIFNTISGKNYPNYNDTKVTQEDLQNNTSRYPHGDTEMNPKLGAFATADKTSIILNLTALACDIGGFIASFSKDPVSIGSSLLLGLGSNIAYLSNDLRDGSQWEDWRNFGIGVGLDAFSIVNPGAKLAKLGKELSILIQYVPWMINAGLITAKEVEGHGFFTLTASKLDTPSSLTFDDFRNILNFVEIITAGAKGAINRKPLKSKDAQYAYMDKDGQFTGETVNLGKAKKIKTEEDLLNALREKGIITADSEFHMESPAPKRGPDGVEYLKIKQKGENGADDVIKYHPLVFKDKDMSKSNFGSPRNGSSSIMRLKLAQFRLLSEIQSKFPDLLNSSKTAIDKSKVEALRVSDKNRYNEFRSMSLQMSAIENQIKYYREFTITNLPAILGMVGNLINRIGRWFSNLRLPYINQFDFIKPNTDITIRPPRVSETNLNTRTPGTDTPSPLIPGENTSTPTSDRNGGVLNYVGKYEEGNKIIKFQSPSSPTPTISGVTHNEGTNWYETIGNYNRQLIIDKFKEMQTPEEQLALLDFINYQQDAHYGIWDIAGRPTDFKTATYSANTKEYEKSYKGLGRDKYHINFNPTKDIFQQRYHIEGANPNTGDNPEQDYVVEGYFSGVNYDRTNVGRKDDYTQDLLNAAQTEFDQLGIEMYLDPETNYYKLRLKNTVQPPQDNPVDQLPSLRDPSNTNGIDNRNGIGNNGKMFNHEAALALARVGFAHSFTNKQEGPIGYRISPYETFTPIQHDLVHNTEMANLAAELMSLDEQTSDSSKNQGSKIARWLQAMKLRREGKLADKQAYDNSLSQSLTNVKEGKKVRTEVGNKNNELAYVEGTAKINNENAKRKAKWTAIDQYLGSRQAINEKDARYLQGRTYEGMLTRSENLRDLLLYNSTAAINDLKKQKLRWEKELKSLKSRMADNKSFDPVDIQESYLMLQKIEKIQKDILNITNYQGLVLSGNYDGYMDEQDAGYAALNTWLTYRSPFFHMWTDNPGGNYPSSTYPRRRDRTRARGVVTSSRNGGVAMPILHIQRLRTQDLLNRLNKCL